MHNLPLGHTHELWHIQPFPFFSASRLPEKDGIMPLPLQPRRPNLEIRRVPRRQLAQKPLHARDHGRRGLHAGLALRRDEVGYDRSVSRPRGEAVLVSAIFPAPTSLHQLRILDLLLLLLLSLSSAVLKRQRPTPIPTPDHLPPGPTPTPIPISITTTTTTTTDPIPIPTPTNPRRIEERYTPKRLIPPHNRLLPSPLSPPPTTSAVRRRARAPVRPRNEAQTRLGEEAEKVVRDAAGADGEVGAVGGEEGREGEGEGEEEERGEGHGEEEDGGGDGEGAVEGGEEVVEGCEEGRHVGFCFTEVGLGGTGK